MPVLTKVLSHDTGLWLTCCWADCEKPGLELFKVIHHEHAKGIPCNHPRATHPAMVFCSERHKMLFVNGHINYGNLPAGLRLLF
jgi:hypothetical protein